MTQLSSSLLPTDDTGNLTSGTALSRAYFSDWRDGINTLVHSATNPTITPADIIDEVFTARNGEASLDARLDAIVALIGASGDAVDTPATYGENVSAGNAIYLSSGSGGGTAGRWYKADNANAYSSATAAAIGFAPNAVLAGASDFARTSGIVTGLSGLTAGTVYYASGTPGGLTSVAPTNQRIFGVALSTTTLLIFPREVAADANNAGLLSLAAQTFVGTKTLNAILSSAVFSALPTGIGSLVFGRASANLTKNANTTLEDIAGLNFAVLANATYIFLFIIHFETATAANAKFTLTGPAAPTGIAFGVSQQAALLAAAGAAAFSTAIQVAVPAAQRQTIFLGGVLRNGANAGTVQAQFAQYASDASNSIAYADSGCLAFRIA